MNIQRFVLSCFFTLVFQSAVLTAEAAPAAATSIITTNADEKFPVAIGMFDGTQNENTENYTQIDVLPGTTAMEAVKLAGLEKLLTDNARLEIYVQKKDTADQSKENVADVRGGKAKDVVLEKSGKDNPTRISIRYNGFDFAGGNPMDFVKALEKQFGVNWSTVHIPEQLSDVRVPAFRKDDSPEGSSYCNPGTVVDLYNFISKRDPGIGAWFFDGRILNPNFVALEPNKDAKASDNVGSSLKVKALPLANIPSSKWSALEDDIEKTQAMVREYASQSSRGGNPTTVVQGTVSIQRDSQILVVIGTQNYIDMVESIVAAYEKNQTIAAPPPPTAPGGK